MVLSLVVLNIGPCSFPFFRLIEAIKILDDFKIKELYDFIKNEVLEAIEYAKKINIKLIIEDEYGLQDFCKNTINNLQSRCADYCYPIRLRKTFEYAKENFRNQETYESINQITKIIKENLIKDDTYGKAFK